MRRAGWLHRVRRSVVRRVHREDRGQSLTIVLALITFLFLIGSAMAAHASVALRSTAASERQAGDLHAADAGAELGIWWQRNGNPGNPPDLTFNGRTVSTTVTASGGSACPTRTPIRLTGFEHGQVSAAGGGLFAAVTGSGVTADGSVSRTGGWSLRIADPAGSSHNAALATSGAVVVARVYLRLDALPATSVTELLVLDTAAGNDLRLGYRAADQRLTLRFGSAAVTASTFPVAAATWYRLDLRLAAGTNPRTADWEIDGVAETSIASAGTASTVSRLRLGSAVGADAYTANFDDVLVSSTSGDYPIGAGAVLPLRPDGAGSHSNPASFLHEDGSAIDATTPTRLDDDPATGTADYVSQEVAAMADYLELTFGDTSASCLVGVSGIVAYHASTSSANAAKTSIFDGATERVLFDGDMSEQALTYRSAIVSRASGWTASAVSALRARLGYATDVAPQPYWDALLLEVATGSATPATITVTSTAGASTVVLTYEDAGTAAPMLLSWSASR
jgi:hypothetical protein